jgi:AraC-like DNA-binding protein
MDLKRYDVRLWDAAKTVCPADWRCETPAQDTANLSLWSVMDGKAMVTLRQGVYPARTGDCFVLRAWDPFLAEHDPTHPLTVLWATFSYRPRSERPEEDALPPVHRRLANPIMFNQFFECLVAMFATDAPAHERAELLLSALLLVMDEQDRRAQPSEYEGGFYDCIQQICQQIRQDPGRPVSVAELAKSIGYSSSHFTRLFHQVTGKTPHDFVIQTRIDLAKSLLRIPSTSISSISEQLGFNDVFHFSAQFHKRTGMTPSDFRRGGAGATASVHHDGTER